MVLNPSIELVIITYCDVQINPWKLYVQINPWKLYVQINPWKLCVYK